MTQVTMKALLETGVHFGHRTRKWDPKMKRYIFTERNGIHIIDLQQTLRAIRDAYELVRDTVSDGGTILFVGTKRQAQETIAREAIRAGMPYVNERWLGGTLTNWRTISQRIDYLKELEQRRDEGEFELLTKKEALMNEREIEKLNIRLGGIREMKRLPDLLFIVDVSREDTTVREANILDIPIVAMVDTNCDPQLIDYVIPANDDAIRAIKLVTSVIADAVIEGKALRKEELEEEEMPEEDYVRRFEDVDEEEDEEAFLGQSTLDKLRSGKLSFEEEGKAKAAAKAQAEQVAAEEDEETEEAEAEAEEIEPVAKAEAVEPVAETEEVEAVAEAEAVEEEDEGEEVEA